MGILNNLFGGAPATSAQITDAITKAEAELAAVRRKIDAAMAGLATFTDEQHIAAEAKQAELKRSEARLVARVEALTAELETVRAAEEAAKRAAEKIAFAARERAARTAATTDALKLLRDYQKAASAVAVALAALESIEIETDAVNEELRKRRRSDDAIPSYHKLHRKAPDRQATTRTERCKVWVLTDPYNGKETVRRATIGPDGEVVPIEQPDPYDRHGWRQGIYQLEDREIVVETISFRLGAYLPSLSEIVLPPALLGQDYIWPRPKKA
ncbi:hypothetical protein [Rhodopseudomonas palustris]|uniref:hypothetical protein n=1 Tax=Rhodopseudomonas palustris TaxID=1076 RepID=UPI000CEC4BD6|nr:hypothetical protein [Rhodopseudomonas palustris]PPQ44133.1 hypothetical protein CKO39_07820 [Rhodopseudomonas palustris]